MPLEGFRVLDWASTTFGGLPPMFLGGMGFVALIAAIAMVVGGIRMQPTSYALIAAGGGTALLTYFIVGAAVAAASSDAVGNAQVAGAAPRMVPWACAVVAAGLGVFGVRMAVKLWSTDELGQKVASVMMALVSVLGMLVAVQVVRGSVFPHAPSATDANAAGDDGADDGTDRPAHGVAGGSRR